MSHPLSVPIIPTPSQASQELTARYYTLYIMSLPELLENDTEITLPTPEGYTFGDLLTEIERDHHREPKAVKRAVRRLKREFRIWNQHIKRKGNPCN